MLTKIGPNKSSFYTLIILQCLFVASIILILYKIIFPLGQHHYQDQSSKYWLYIAVFIVVGARFIPKFYLIPYWVIVDDDFKTLEVKYVVKKTKFIRREDMISYSDTNIYVTTKSRTTRYSGFYLHLFDGKKILFSEQNFAVEDYVYVESMLAYWGVKKLGDE